MIWFILSLCAVAVCFAIWSFCTCPGKPSNEKTAFFSVRPFAHRGAFIPGSIPENSLAAFGRACSLGYGIELDVRLSKDGHLCVLHDSSLLRMTGVDRRIETLDLHELKAYDLDGTDESPPSLREVLSLVNGRVPLLIEMKSNGPKDDPSLIPSRLQKEMAGYTGKWCVESFDPRMLRECRRLGFTVPIGQLSQKQPLIPLGKWLHGRLACNFVSRPDFIAYRSNAFPPGVKRLRRRSVPVIAWTVRSESEWLRLQSICSNYIFEGFLPDKKTNEITGVMKNE